MKKQPTKYRQIVPSGGKVYIKDWKKLFKEIRKRKCR